MGASWRPLGASWALPGSILEAIDQKRGWIFFPSPRRGLQMGLLGLSWALGLLGRSWGALGRSWGPLGLLGPSWAPLGALLGSWALGPSWRHLEASEAHRGRKWERPNNIDSPRASWGSGFSPHVKWGFCFLSTHVAPASPSPSLPPPSPSGQHSTPLLTHSTHSPAQHGATQRSTPQHSTSHHSTAQHSSADHKWGHILDTIGCAQGVVPEGGRYALCTTVV